MSSVNIDPLDKMTTIYTKNNPDVVIESETMTVTATSTANYQGISRHLLIPEKAVYHIYATGYADIGTDAYLWVKNESTGVTVLGRDDDVSLPTGASSTIKFTLDADPRGYKIKAGIYFKNPTVGNSFVITKFVIDYQHIHIQQQLVKMVHIHIQQQIVDIHILEQL